MRGLELNEQIYLAFLVLLILAYYSDGIIPRLIVILLGVFLGDTNGWKMWVETVMGIMISPTILKIMYALIYRITLENKQCMGFFEADVIIDAMFEELMWRDILHYLIINEVPKSRDKIILILLFSILFVWIHHVCNAKSYVEMFIFTLLLWISVCMGTRIHYGLHIGRNFLK